MAKVDIIGEVPLPKIRFTKYAMKWIAAMVEAHSEEIGFYGVVERDGNVFTITDIFYPKHELVTSATCEIDPEGMRDIMSFLMDKGRDTDIGKLKMWGHSHVNMGVTPSGQDETQAMVLVKDNGDYLIRLIANKKGDLGITLFDIESRLKYSDLPYSVIESDEEINKKLHDIAACYVPDANNADILAAIRLIAKANDLKDDDYKEIIKKIEELKLVNIPKKTYQSYGNGYTGGYGGYGGNHNRQVEPKKTTDFPTSTSASPRESIKAASTANKSHESDYPESPVGSRNHADLQAYYEEMYGI